MKGLLIKDLQLTASNKRLYLIVIGISVLLLIAGSEMATFIVGYVTLIFALQVLTTITYDDYDHSNAFLLTMPVTRSLYTVEKYVFALVSTAIGWGVSALGIGVYHHFTTPGLDWTEWFVGCVSILGVALLLVCVSIPVQLKFGGENGRIVVVAIIVVCVVAAFLLAKLMAYLGLQAEDMIQNLFITNKYIFWPVVVVILAALYAVSVFCSIRIMRKKEF